MENSHERLSAKSSASQWRRPKPSTGGEKPSRFSSFRWFLRKDKNERAAKKMPISDVRESSSSDFCRTDCSLLPADRKRPAGFWQKLCSFTSRSRSPSCYGPKFASASKLLKTSFSSGDVARLRTAGISPPGRPSSTTVSASQSCYDVLPPSARSSRSALPHEMECLSLGAAGGRLLSRDRDLDRKPSSTEGSRPSRGSSWNGSQLDLMLCKLCLTMIPTEDMYQLRTCGCLFCHACLHQYFTINIREGGIVLTCPDAECRTHGFVDVAEVEKLVDSDVYDMFKRLTLDREIERDPLRTWCPGAGCETVCYVGPGGDLDCGIPIRCPSCFLTFCSSCKQKWHSDRTCTDVQQKLQEEEFPVPGDEDAPIKRCPNCRVPIERDEGCAQMMCKRCKHVFCWYCLASLDDDFLLRHYDKGPCKNKLGHSRASVVWHRTQVVSIFAGFGFLLLVASPVLLLVAPCLLCCRCKHCSKLLEDEPTSV